MARRVVLIEHDDSPNDDRAATWLAERGFEFDWRRPYAGDSLGEPDGSVAGTIIYGGPQSVPDNQRQPFMRDEARWIEGCVRKEIPTLGLCLGGQMIAHALGAEVRPGANGYHEFGYYPLFPTDEGRSHFPDELYVTQAHFHEFELPDGAVLLARSELYPHQAFRYGDTTFAFQFHPECTIAGFRRWQDSDWAPWDQPGVQPREQQDTLAAKHDQAQHDWFCDFLEKLFARPGQRE